MADFKFDNYETAGAAGLDALLAAEPELTSPVGQSKKAATRLKVASLEQLQGFKRVSGETLVNKSTRDLWAIRQEGQEFFIERLFQDDGSPLKG